MAGGRGGRKVAKVTFCGRRVTYIRQGGRFGASLFRKMIERSTKLYVLIIELYGIAGVVNILLDVTFLCVAMWIYVCTRMYWRIVT